jgi:hypothetical protein
MLPILNSSGGRTDNVIGVDMRSNEELLRIDLEDAEYENLTEDEKFRRRTLVIEEIRKKISKTDWHITVLKRVVSVVAYVSLLTILVLLFVLTL